MGQHGPLGATAADLVLKDLLAPGFGECFCLEFKVLILGGDAAHSGVPVYRQLIDQVQAAIASEVLNTADHILPVLQVAVDLTTSPNTVSICAFASFVWPTGCGLTFRAGKGASVHGRPIRIAYCRDAAEIYHKHRFRGHQPYSSVTPLSCRF